MTLPEAYQTDAEDNAPEYFPGFTPDEGPHMPPELFRYMAALTQGELLVLLNLFQHFDDDPGYLPTLQTICEGIFNDAGEVIVAPTYLPVAQVLMALDHLDEMGMVRPYGHNDFPLLYKGHACGWVCLTWGKPRPHQRRTVPGGQDSGGADVGAATREKVFERDAYRCQICGAHRDLTIDHITPRSKGGNNALHNLRCLCRPCNVKKGAR